MSVTRIARLSLITLWVIVLTSIGLVTFGALNKPVVESVDNYFRDIYLNEPKQRLLDILNAFDETGDAERVVADLVTLLDDLEAQQKTDDLVAEKRAAYAQLVRVFFRLGQFDTAAYWVQQWLAYDPKDVEALLARGRLLLINADTRAEGEYELALLQARFPNSLAIANGRAIAFASIGELGQAFREFEPFLPDSINPMTRKLGQTLRTIDYSHSAGDEISHLSEHFKSGESLFLKDSFEPDDSIFFYELKGLTQIDGGFRKYIGNHGELRLQRMDPAKDLSIHIDVIVTPPESLEKLMDPRFQPLVIDQLIASGHPESAARYRSYAATL